MVVPFYHRVEGVQRRSGAYHVLTEEAWKKVRRMAKSFPAPNEMLMHRYVIDQKLVPPPESMDQALEAARVRLLKIGLSMMLRGFPVDHPTMQAICKLVHLSYVTKYN